MEDTPDGRDGQPRPDSLLPYDLWTEEALRQVVVRALAHVGAEGMPCEHHFYVSFRTDRPGVSIPTRLLTQYPHEMTIVLQHQFWDLGVTEHTFEVGLSFSGIPERLLIPFDALVGFFDPSVQFGLKFELNGETAQSQAEGDNDAAPADAAPKGKLPALKPAPRLLIAADTAEVSPAPPSDAKPRAKVKSDAQTDTDQAAGDDEDGDKQSAKVLSLDAFRKKP